jgi:cell wall-associated NlpC family hydrolase
MLSRIMAFDPRVTPARPDLAAEHLRGQVEAARFAPGQERSVIAPIAPLRREPRPDASLDTEALFGERVTVYEVTEEGWAWGQLAADGYVGWIPAAALAAPGASPTHTVTATRTLVFPGPSIKLPPVDALPFGARLAVIRRQPPFAIAQIGHVPDVHLSEIGTTATDWVSVAEQFLGVPYLWGGKTVLGIDCSGLVQTALTACGIACPRDSDMQERALGAAVLSNGRPELARGDLVFWKGHVALARDPHTLIHANAFHMAVASEPATVAFDRILAAGGPITSIRRIG